MSSNILSFHMNLNSSRPGLSLDKKITAKLVRAQTIFGELNLTLLHSYLTALFKNVPEHMSGSE